jgi:ATP-dependent DNA helicase RecG
MENCSENDVIAELGVLAPKEVIALKAAGVETVMNLLDRVPKRYEDRRRFDAFPTQASSQAVCLRGMVVDAGGKFYGSSRGVNEVVVQAGNGAGFGENSITCRWFNASYISKILAVGQEIVLYGKPKDVNGKLIIDHPEFEVIKEGEETKESVHVERIVPVYKNITGIAQRRLREIVFLLLEGVDGDSLGGEFNVDESYPRIDAYREVHFPKEMEQVEAARRFFALEEFVRLQLEVARRRRKYHQQQGRVQAMKMHLLTEFYQSLPFDLTDAQKRCVKEIIHDMRSPLPMNRMLQGDVGSGKTFVALCAALLAVDSGAQVALMAPTQILAEQHYLTFRKWLDPLEVRVGLTTSDRDELGEVSWSEKPQILIGTHALLYGENVFDDLGLVIIDEQHKFGVEQRGRLVKKGVMPDVLVMTATPIPRTLTLTIYGDLDVSVIDELPQGRGKIITGVRPKAKVSDVTKFLKEQLDQGRQAYIIYPLVEESESLKAGAATVEYEKWQKRLGGGGGSHQVSLIHGKMSADDKEQVMKDFRDNRSQVLVSTSVVEVGVDVANASVMVIYDAERFGLSQLHQLRGRIGRGAHKSYCILVTQSTAAKNPDALEKLQVLADTIDGFKISEADLKMRGPGDVLGTEQSGLADMRFIEYLADVDLIREARRLADEILDRD